VTRSAASIYITSLFADLSQYTAEPASRKEPAPQREEIALMTIARVRDDNCHDDNLTYDAESAPAMPRKMHKNSRLATNSPRRASS
jgi:hypothetical protein